MEATLSTLHLYNLLIRQVNRRAPTTPMVCRQGSSIIYTILRQAVWRCAWIFPVHNPKRLLLQKTTCHLSCFTRAGSVPWFLSANTFNFDCLLPVVLWRRGWPLVHSLLSSPGAHLGAGLGTDSAFSSWPLRSREANINVPELRDQRNSS